MGSSRIVADALTARALAARLGDVPQGHHVVYAHSAPDGRRGPLAGLSWLEGNLASGKPLEGSVTVAGFLRFQEIGPFHYLFEQPRGGIAYVQLPDNLCDLPVQPQLEEEQRLQVRRDASERVLERCFSAQRHEFKGLAAAVRIYLGMLAEGHAPADEAEKTLSAMADAAKGHPDCGPRPQVDGARVARLVSQHRTLLEQVGSRQHSAQPALRLAMLDDHVHDHLWDRALGHICVDGKLLAYEAWEGESGLRAGLDSLPDDTVLLLDCKLGDDAGGPKVPTGLELLHSIRSARPDIQIIMLSAYDDAPLALACMRAGANGYFVKELTDAQDRSSRDYYEHLLKTLAPMGQLGHRLAQLWREFCRVGVRGNRSNALIIPETIEDHVRLAFLLGFAQLESNPLSGLYGTVPSALASSPSGWPVIAVLAAGWCDRKDDCRSNARAALEEHFAKVHHPDSAGITLEDGLSCLKEVVDRCWGTGSDEPLARAPASPTLPRPCPYTHDELQRGWGRPRGGISSQGAPNTDEEARGAVELARGLLCDDECAFDHKSVADVAGRHAGGVDGEQEFASALVLDYGADRSGWRQAFELVLPGVVVVTEPPEDGAELAGLLRGKQAVLLDLRLPRLECSLNALEGIQACDPSLPVVAMSAGTDYVSAMRAFRRGAVDFVAKVMPFERSGRQCIAFCYGLQATMRLAMQLGARGGGCRRLLGCSARLQAAAGGWATSADTVEAMGHIRREQERDYVVVPEADEWAGVLGSRISLVSAICRWYWLSRQTAPLGPARRKDGRVRSVLRSGLPAAFPPLDAWRAEALGLAKLDGKRGSLPALAQAVAVLCGGTMDTMATWLWCWQNRSPLQCERWGGTDINIARQIRDRLGEDARRVWKWRNDALNGRVADGGWGDHTLEFCSETMLAAVSRFARVLGWPGDPAA